MRYIFDSLICILLGILIYTITGLGNTLLQISKEPRKDVTSVGFYKCGKNKRTELYCPITVKGD